LPFDAVLFSLRSPLDRANLLAAARAAGLPAAEWLGDGEGYATRSELRAVAIIWDLDDGNPARLGILHDLRARRPALPVLLLLPVRPGAISLAAQAGRIPGVQVRGMWRQPADAAFLGRFLRDAHDRAPVHRTLEELLGAPPDRPLVLTRFLEAVLDRQSKDQPATVGHIAADLGLTLRRLRLRWPPPPCPPPAQLACWAEIMLFAVLGAADKRTPNVIAKAFGRDEKSFARLRQRLALPPLGAHDPATTLEIVRAAYRERWRRDTLVGQATAS